MRNLQFDPFWRTSVGFDRLFTLMDESREADTEGNYPPYNINRTGEESCRISLAIAGFKAENVTVTAHQNAVDRRTRG